MYIYSFSYPELDGMLDGLFIRMMKIDQKKILQRLADLEKVVAVVEPDKATSQPTSLLTSQPPSQPPSQLTSQQTSQPTTQPEQQTTSVCPKTCGLLPINSAKFKNPLLQWINQNLIV